MKNEQNFLDTTNYLKTTSHSDIGSLKNAIEEEWNKISEEFILKVCKSFWRRFDSIIEKKKKWSPYWVDFLFYVIYLLIQLIYFGKYYQRDGKISPKRSSKPYKYLKYI